MQKRRRVAEEYQLAPGERLVGEREYRVIRCLGGGAFALAYQVADEQGQILFAKELREPERPSEAEERLRVYHREVDVLRRLGNYELIPRLHDAFENAGFHYIVQDYIEGVDLDTVLRSGKTLDQRTVVRWCVCLCHILAFMHSRNVVHHDLKPANIRLNQDGDPVVLDFGAARWYRRPDEKVETLYGTEGYLAPEYAEQAGEDLAAGMRMDVFAMGRILVEIMVGKRLSQEDIDRRTQQLYGSILHSQLLDDNFVRAVFRSVDYDRTRRYASGMEMERDVVAVVPPLARARPKELIFREQSGPWRETSFVVYNVGGGTLKGTARVEGDWLALLGAGDEPVAELPIQRNRTTLRAVARPEGVPPGQSAEARIVLELPDQEPVLITARLERAAEPAEVRVSPTELRLNVRPGEWGQGDLTFRNHGRRPARVELELPAELPVGVDPPAFTLGPDQQQTVTVSVDAGAVGDADTELVLFWRLDGGERQALPLKVRVRKAGLLGAIKLPFRRGG